MASPENFGSWSPVRCIACVLAVAESHVILARLSGMGTGAFASFLMRSAAEKPNLSLRASPRVDSPIPMTAVKRAVSGMIPLPGVKVR